MSLYRHSTYSVPHHLPTSTTRSQRVVIAHSQPSSVPCVGRKVACRHILCDDKRTLQEAAIQLESGEDFADVASQFSICPSKANGGKIGWIIRGMASSAVENAVLDKPVGAICTVESEGGWHLIEVLEESVPAADQVPPEDQKPQILSISVQTLAELLTDPHAAEQAQFIDVREIGEYQIAALKGFELYPLSEVGSWLPTIASELDPTKDTFVLCHHGVRSMHASNFLLKQGFQRVYNISGGIAAYSSVVDASVPQY